jgi:DNA-binding NtrC family response regulator
MGSTILVVDDEPNAVKVLSAILREEGYHVLASMNVDQAMGVLKSEDIDAVITDMKMPDKDGFQLFNYVSRHHPYTPVMFLTAYGSVESAVQAMTSGAYHYFIKPPDYPKLKNVLATAIEQHASKKQVENLKRRSCQRATCTHYREYPSMDRIAKRSKWSGLGQQCSHPGRYRHGKEVIACSLHFLSKRFNKPLSP